MNASTAVVSEQIKLLQPRRIRIPRKVQQSLAPPSLVAIFHPSLSTAPETSAPLVGPDARDACPLGCPHDTPWTSCSCLLPPFLAPPPLAAAWAVIVAVGYSSTAGADAGADAVAAGVAAVTTTAAESGRTANLLSSHRHPFDSPALGSTCCSQRSGAKQRTFGLPNSVAEDFPRPRLPLLVASRSGQFFGPFLGL